MPYDVSGCVFFTVNGQFSVKNEQFWVKNAFFGWELIFAPIIRNIYRPFEKKIITWVLQTPLEYPRMEPARILGPISALQDFSKARFIYGGPPSMYGALGTPAKLYWDVPAVV